MRFARAKVMDGASASNHSGDPGDLVFDSTNKKIFVHDGSTVGGVELVGEELFAAKGDLVIGSGDGTSAILSAGNDDVDILVPDAAEDTGMKWVPAGTRVEYDGGTVATGTYTPDQADGQFQYYINGGAHTLAPPTASCDIVLQITNNASAGTVTTSGFTHVDGTFATTDALAYLCRISVINSLSYMEVIALQ